MPEITSPLTYHSVDELQAMSAEELTALADQIPAERPRVYKAEYDRWLRKQGVMTTVGSDSLEKDILLDMFAQYQQSALVPAGESTWVKVPPTTQVRARQNEGIVEVDNAPAAPRVNPMVIVVVLVVRFACLLLVLVKLGGKKPNAA